MQVKPKLSAQEKKTSGLPQGHLECCIPAGSESQHKRRRKKKQADATTFTFGSSISPVRSNSTAKTEPQAASPQQFNSCRQPLKIKKSIKTKSSTRNSLSIHCDPEHVLPPDVINKLLPTLLHNQELQIKQIHLTGGAARQIIFDKIAKEHCSESISDLDFSIETDEVEKTAIYLQSLGFIKSNVAGANVWTYHPPLPGEISYSSFSSPYSIDITISEPKNPKVPQPCFNIDTLFVNVLEQNHGEFIIPAIEHLFDTAWHPSSSATANIPPPTINEVSEKNPLTIFRALRLMHVHNLYDYKIHNNLLGKICENATDGSVLKKLNFCELLSVLHKFFWRQDIFDLVARYDLSYSLNPNSDICNTLLATLSQALPYFYRIMAENNQPFNESDKQIEFFILNKLYQFDEIAPYIDYKTKTAKLFALLFFPAYINSNVNQSFADFTISQFQLLISKIGPGNLPPWLELNTSCKAIIDICKQLEKFRLEYMQYIGCYSRLQKNYQPTIWQVPKTSFLQSEETKANQLLKKMP